MLTSTFNKTIIVLLMLAGATAGSNAQRTVLLDADKKTTKSDKYAFRRVIAFSDLPATIKSEVDYYGDIHYGVDILNGYYFSIKDYYRSGEPEFVGTAFSITTDPVTPADYVLTGKALWYFKNGRLKKSGHYNSYGLHGELTYYREDGSILKKELYQNGKRIDGAATVSGEALRLIGQWRHTEYNTFKNYFTGKPDVNYTLTASFSNNTVLRIDAAYALSSILNKTEYTNWKYIPTNATQGILEQYEGNTLKYRGAVRWISPYAFEYVNTYHSDPNKVGIRRCYYRM